MAAILFLLVSGFYNFLRYEFQYKLPPLYHALFLIKFLLALAIFYIASLLAGRSEAASAFAATLDTGSRSISSWPWRWCASRA